MDNPNPNNPIDFQLAFNKQIQAIKSAAESQSLSVEKLKKKYIDDKKSGFYNYFANIPSENMFIYYLLFMIIFFFVSQMNFTFSKVISVLICCGIIFFLNEKRRSTSISRMQELELKLDALFPKPKFFYLDAGIIELVHSIREYSSYNVITYNRLIKVLDNFLELTLDIERNIKNGYTLYDNLVDLKKEALNTLQSMIFSVPSDIKAENKLDDATESLHFILNFHLEKIRIQINKDYKETGPQNNNKYIDETGPSPTDDNTDYHYSLY